MKRYVVKEDGGYLGIVTATAPPPNALCEARDEWLSHEISEANGVVYIDTDKVRKIAQAHEKMREHERKTRLIKKVKQNLNWVIVVVAFAIGYWIGRI